MKKNKDKASAVICKLLSIKFSKKSIAVFTMTVLAVNVVFSILLSRVTKDYNHFAFAVGEVALIHIIVVIMYSTKVINGAVKHMKK